jgi:hypothetical protein
MAAPYAVDWSPLSEAIDSNRQYGLARNKLGMEQERLGFEREMQPFKVQQAKQQVDTGELEYKKSLSQMFGGIGTEILNEPDPAKKAAYAAQIASHPGMRAMFDKALPPGWQSNPDLIGHFTSQIARGYKDPGAEAAQSAATYHQLGAGAASFAEARAKDPAIAAAKMLLANKIMRGETVTKEDVDAAYSTTNNAAPPMPGMPLQRLAPSPPQPSANAVGNTNGGPPGSRGSPVYAPTPQAISQLPDQTWYTTPGNLTVPQQKVGTTPSVAAPAPPGVPGIVVTQPRQFSPGQVPQGGDPTSRATVPYAPEASRTVRPYQTGEDQRLAMLHMIDPTLRQAWENTPGHKAAVKAAELRATKGVESEEKQAQGTEMIRQIDELRDRMVNVGPDVVKYATGPYLSDPAWQKKLALLPFGNGEGSVLEQAQILNTKVQHTIDALATQMGALQGGGKGATDQSRDELKSAVGKAFESRGAAGVFEVLHDAKRNIQGLSRLPIDAPLKDYNPPEWAKQQGSASTQPATPANADQPKAGAPVWDAVDKVYRERGPDGKWHPVQAAAEEAPEAKAKRVEEARMAPKERAALRRQQAATRQSAPDYTQHSFDADIEGMAYRNGLDPVDVASKYDSMRMKLRPDQLRVLENLISQAERSAR